MDFRGGYTSDWCPPWQDFYCDRRNMHFNQGIEPLSRGFGDQVLTSGTTGILFNSANTARANLVIYTDALAGADTVAVHDPDNAPLKNQQSWE